MANIKTIIESKRAAGYKQPGGLYLVGGVASLSCGKLPITLTVCPCCGAGIKFSRGFTWINSKFIEEAKCQVDEQHCNDQKCSPFDHSINEFGLLWVGESFYKTPAKFLTEASIAGISKRIASVPRRFEIGKTWILLAHIHAITKFPDPNKPEKIEFQKGIFSAFRPTAIQYVITGKETEEELDKKEARGITLVKIVRDTDAQKSFDEELTKFTYQYTIKSKGKIKTDFLYATSRGQANRIITQMCEKIKRKLVRDSIKKVSES